MTRTRKIVTSTSFAPLILIVCAKNESEIRYELTDTLDLGKCKYGLINVKLRRNREADTSRIASVKLQVHAF